MIHLFYRLNCSLTLAPMMLQAVIKASYYDTPLAVSLSSSQPSVSTVRDRDRDYYTTRPSPRPSLPTYPLPDHLSHHKPSTPPYYFAGIGELLTAKIKYIFYPCGPLFFRLFFSKKCSSYFQLAYC